MTFTLFSVALIFLFATIVAIEIYRAVKRGYEKTLISLGSLIFSAILSLIVSPSLSGILTRAVMNNALRPMKDYKNLIRSYPSFDVSIEAVISSISSTVFFVILFFVIKWVTSWIVSSIVKNIVKEAVDGEVKVSSDFALKNKKLLSIVLGSLCAVFITMVITSPLMGALNIVRKGIKLAETGSSKFWQDARIDESEVDKLEGYSYDVVGNVFYECGGKFMFRAAARSEIYGETVYLMNEVDAIEGVLQDFLNVYGVLVNPSDVTAEDIDSLRNVSNKVGKLNLSRGIIADYFSECSDAWLNGYIYFKIRKPMIKTAAEPLVDEILEVCRNSNVSDVQDNLSAIIDIYEIVIENDLINASKNGTGAVINTFEEGDVINKMSLALDKYSSMQHIDPSLLVMNVIRDYFEKTGYGQSYHLFIENVTDAILNVQQRGYGSKEEKTVVMTSYMAKYLEGFDEFTGKTARYVSSYILNSFGETYPTIDMVDSLFRKQK